MKPYLFSSTLIKTRLALLCFALLTLSACAPLTWLGFGGGASTDGEGTTNAQQSIIDNVRKIDDEKLLNLPEIVVGDTYVFSNPSVAWEAINVEQGRITWVSNQGARIVTSQNPLLPSFEWISKTDGEGSRLISDISGNLFPLKVGNKMSFRSTVAIKGQRTQWSFTWQCAILDETETEVVAGKFDTFRIACARDAEDTINYYYAPQLGYYVRIETGGSKGALLKRRDLLSYNNFTGSTLKVGENLTIKDDVDAGLRNDKVAPVLPLPIDDITPDPKANLEAKNFINQNRPNRNEDVLPIPGDLKPIEPTGTTPTPEPKTPTSSLPIITPDYDENAGRGRAGSIDREVVAHLASYFDQETAERGWQILSNRYPELLKGKRARIVRTDLGAIGIFYRLYADPFGSLEAAADLCKRLKNQGAYCQVSEI